MEINIESRYQPTEKKGRSREMAKHCTAANLDRLNSGWRGLRIISFDYSLPTTVFVEVQ